MIPILDNPAVVLNKLVEPNSRKNKRKGAVTESSLSDKKLKILMRHKMAASENHDDNNDEEINRNIHIVSTQGNIPLSNHYDILTDESDNIDDLMNRVKSKNNNNNDLNSMDTSERQSNKSNRQPNKTNTNSNNSNSSSRADAAQNANNNKNKPPPLNIFNQNITDLIKIIKLKLKINNFTVKKITNNKHAIHTVHIHDYQTIKSLLLELNTPYFTYTPKQDKCQTFLLKGLTHDEEEDNIKQELQHHEGENLKIIKVKKFSTKNSLKNNINLPIFLVQINSDSQSAELVKIKYLNHQVIKWERIKKKVITQCFRCQRFGHTASNCCLSYRCVKCGNSNHEPGNCPINTESDKKMLYCVQCKSYGHPASYKGCPRHIELINKIKAKKNEKSDKQAMFTNFVQNEISYASKLNSQKNMQLHTPIMSPIIIQYSINLT